MATQKNNELTFIDDIAKLPDSFILQMRDALEKADLDQFILLINEIEEEHSSLAEYLSMLARNYDYNHLQQLLSHK